MVDLAGARGQRRWARSPVTAALICFVLLWGGASAQQANPRALEPPSPPAFPGPGGVVLPRGPFSPPAYEPFYQRRETRPARRPKPESWR